MQRNSLLIIKIFHYATLMPEHHHHHKIVWHNVMLRAIKRNFDMITLSEIKAIKSFA